MQLVTRALTGQRSQAALQQDFYLQILMEKIPQMHCCYFYSTGWFTDPTNEVCQKISTLYLLFPFHPPPQVQLFSSPHSSSRPCLAGQDSKYCGEVMLHNQLCSRWIPPFSSEGNKLGFSPLTRSDVIFDTSACPRMKMKMAHGF